MTPFQQLAVKSDLIFCDLLCYFDVEVFMSLCNIRVFYSSRTVGGFKGRQGMQPVCHSCDKTLGKSNELHKVVPPDAMTLVFPAEIAAKELGTILELVNVTQMSFRERINERLNGLPVPRISIGGEFITGHPTKDEIITLYHRVCGLSSDA